MDIYRDLSKVLTVNNDGENIKLEAPCSKNKYKSGESFSDTKKYLRILILKSELVI